MTKHSHQTIEDTEAWADRFESIDDADWRDAASLRAIVTARESGDRQQLRQAVATARAEDAPWMAIGVMLGVSASAAEAEFGPRTDGR